MADNTSETQPEITPIPRGKEMRANLLTKLRAPPLVHAWDFWHDRQDRITTNNNNNNTTTSPSTPTSPTSSSSTTTPLYEERLVHLASITDLRTFWSVFNNFPLTSLPLRDSIHLFHHTIKPLWEDPRNMHGGCWTFRVPKALAPEFWQQVCLLAIGEQLQAAVESDRVQFRDDVCGVSCSVRFTSLLVSVWNRDKGHEEGKTRLLEKVLGGVTDEVRPKEGTYYYKAHNEHAAFGGRDRDGGEGAAGSS